MRRCESKQASKQRGARKKTCVRLSLNWQERSQAEAIRRPQRTFPVVRGCTASSFQCSITCFMLTCRSATLRVFESVSLHDRFFAVVSYVGKTFGLLWFVGIFEVWGPSKCIEIVSGEASSAAPTRPNCKRGKRTRGGIRI